MGRLVALALFLAGCLTSTEEARSALLDQGFTAIQMTGWEWGCSKDDGTCDGFLATGPTGRAVRGVVGCGGPLSFKGCTVRIVR